MLGPKGQLKEHTPEEAATAIVDHMLKPLNDLALQVLELMEKRKLGSYSMERKSKRYVRVLVAEKSE